MLVRPVVKRIISTVTKEYNCVGLRSISGPLFAATTHDKIRADLFHGDIVAVVAALNNKGIELRSSSSAQADVHGHQISLLEPFERPQPLRASLA
jgi:hypothetical protein